MTVYSPIERIPSSSNVAPQLAGAIVLPNVAAAAATNVPTTSSLICTLCYTSLAYGGGASYTRVSSQPSHAGKIQVADGSWFELAEPMVCPQMFGATGKNVIDDTTALQNFFSFCYATRKLGYATSADAFKFTSQLTITFPSFYELKGARFYPSGMSSGYVIQVNGAMGTQPFNLSCKMDGFALVGPIDLAQVLDGITMGGTGQTVANVAFRDLQIYGFRDQIQFGSNVYLIKFHDHVLEKFTRYSHRYDCTLNAGENISWWGGAFANGVNAGTARCVYSTTENPFLDVSYNACSFDYSDTNFEVNAGTFDFNNCHWENGNQLVMGIAAYTSGKPHPTIRINGGDMTFGTGGSNRATIFDVTGACTFEANGLVLDNFDPGNSTSLIVTHGLATKIVSKFMLNPGTSGTPVPCTVTNQLYNYDFTVGTTAWTTSLQAGSAVDATTLYTFGGRTYASFMFVLNASNAQFIKQRARVDPSGLSLFLSAIKAVSLTTGSASISVSYYASDGTSLISTATAGVAVTAAQGFTSNGTQLRIPQGAVYADISLSVTAGAGTVYFALPGVWSL